MTRLVGSWIVGIVLVLALGIGGWLAGGRMAADRERALLAQLRLLTEQYHADRQTFIEALRTTRGERPFVVTLPSLAQPADVRVVERGPAAVRVELSTPAQVSRQDTERREQAGATVVRLTIKPEDLRARPPDERVAVAVQDPATGAFACVAGTLCEAATTRVTLPTQERRSRWKVAVTYPLGVGVAYEVFRLQPVAVDAVAVMPLGSALDLRIGAGLAYQVSPRVGIGGAWTVGARGDSQFGIYATWRW